MIKQKENETYVWYQFKQEIPGEFYINEKGKRRLKTISKVGVFKFNKKSEILEFDIQKTDLYFLDYPRIKYQCLYVMKQYNKEKFFPEKTCYASG